MARGIEVGRWRNGGSEVENRGNDIGEERREGGDGEG